MTLEGLSRSHIPSLWQHLRLWENTSLLDYIPLNLPSSGEEDLWSSLEQLRTERQFVWYAILADPQRVNPGKPGVAPAHARKETLGIIAYLNIFPQNRDIEVGAVIFSPALQKSAAATEVHYLLLKNVCEANSTGLGGSSLPYRRIAWKCNHLNTSSRRAAERLGYVFEGTFRKHLISKGRSRDTDWLSIVDDEWPVVKMAFEEWLKPENFDEEGRQKKKLDQIRAEMKTTDAV